MRLVGLVGAGMLVALAIGVPAAQAVPGSEMRVYYEVTIGGEPVAEEPGNVRVFSECGGALDSFCTVANGFPPQELAVFAGDTRVGVGVTGGPAEAD